MFAFWWQRCPAVGPLGFATRAFAVTPQARQLLLDEKASLSSNKTWFGYRIKQPECYGYVYLWYDKKQRKLCIGSHHKRACKASVWDGYLTSTGQCKKEIEKRPYDFRFRVLEYNVDENCLKRTQALEQKWLDKIPENQLEGQRYIRYYNQCRFAGGGFAMNSSVAAKISATQKKAVADGTHNFVHSHPMKDAATKEKMRATVAKAVANGTHNFKHSNPMRDPAIKEKIIAKIKITTAKAVANGTHHFMHSHPMRDPIAKEKWKARVAKDVANGTHNFIYNNPMRNPPIKEKIIAKMKITLAKAVASGTHHFVYNNPMKNHATKEKANEKRKITVAKAVADGTHNFIHSHPSKNPIAVEKRTATIAKAVANGTHHFICSHPLKNPVTKAKRKATFEKKKKDVNP